MLSHITQTAAGLNKWEGFQTDNFRLTFIFSPTIAFEPLITEHVMSCTGWQIPETELAEQDQGAIRLFAKNKISTKQELAITLSLNFNEENDLYIYTSLLAAKNAMNNHNTFELGLKRDYAFDINVEYFLRNNVKVYERTLKNCMFFGAFGAGIFDADIADSELKMMEVNVAGEYFPETSI